MRWFILAAALALAALTAPNAWAKDRLVSAIDDHDIAALTAASMGATARAQLARGALENYRGQDSAALENLQAVGEDARTAPEARRTAYIVISSIRLRQGRFADAAAAFDAANHVAREPDATKAAAEERSRVLARALASVPVMRTPNAPHGEASIHRDVAGLPRVDVQIGDVTENAVLDTGAGYSTMTETQAARAQLRMLDAHISIGSAVATATPARLGIADTLTLGGAQFHDVVFIVLPDAGLSFDNGAYTIDTIVGLPVLINLGRLEFVAGRQEALRFAPSQRSAGADSNLMLDGLVPFALLRVDPVSRPLSFFIDTGADSTSLNFDRRHDFPELLAHATRRQTRVGGAGGAILQQYARTVPALTLYVGPNAVVLHDVSVLDLHKDDFEGSLGQDVLRSGGSYAIDFDALRIETGPSPATSH